MGNSSLPRWAVFKPTKTRINPRLYLHTYTTSTRPPTRPLLLYFTWPCPANAIRICPKNECLSGKRINNVAVIKTVNLQNSSSSEQSGPPGRSPECHTLYPLYFPISSLLAGRRHVLYSIILLPAPLSTKNSLFVEWVGPLAQAGLQEFNVPP